MGLISDGNSEQVGHAWRKIGFFGEKSPNFDCSRSNQMPKTDQIKEIALLTWAPISEVPSNIRDFLAFDVAFDVFSA